MVGLSLADRNIRRLLEALRHSPVQPNIFALMQKPKPVDVTDDDTEAIHSRAKAIVHDFEDAGIKFEDYYGTESVGAMRQGRQRPGLKRAVFDPSSGGPRLPVKGQTRYAYEIRKIIAQVDRLEQRFQTEVLRSLGVAPIWYDSHDEIPDILTVIPDQGASRRVCVSPLPLESRQEWGQMPEPEITEELVAAHGLKPKEYERILWLCCFRPPSIR